MGNMPDAVPPRVAHHLGKARLIGAGAIRRRVMDRQHVANATAAWVEAWLYGNARPHLVIGALERIGAQVANDAQAHAMLERAWRVVAGTPFGSVAEPVAI
jgi:hypothetical protein